MATKEMEERLTRLEEQVAQMAQERETPVLQEPAWWEQIIGIFEGDPHFEEAMRLGREWRELEQMEYNDDEIASP